VSELLKDIDEQLFGIKGATNRLRKYLWWYLRRSEQAPLDVKIVYLFLKTNASFMTTEIYSNVKKLYSHLLEIFKDMSYSIFENLDHLFELMIGAFAAGPSRDSAPIEAQGAVSTAGTVEMHAAGASL
jgi:hypothetical protein